MKTVTTVETVKTEPDLLTHFQVARLIPNRKGDDTIHPKTLLRRIDRKEFPEPDVTFTDGTRLYRRSTLRAAGILPPEATAVRNQGV